MNLKRSFGLSGHLDGSSKDVDEPADIFDSAGLDAFPHFRRIAVNAGPLWAGRSSRTKDIPARLHKRLLGGSFMQPLRGIAAASLTATSTPRALACSAESGSGRPEHLI